MAVLKVKENLFLFCLLNKKSLKNVLRSNNAEFSMLRFKKKTYKSDE